MLYMIAPRFIYSITGNFVPSGPLHTLRPLPPPSASGITDPAADELCLGCFPRFHTWGHATFVFLRLTYLASQVMLVVKNPPANAGDTREEGSIPQSGRPPWRRKWQPTPVFLPGESHGQRGLVGYRRGAERWKHVWLISLSIRPSTSFHVVANDKISFFLMDE